MSILKRWNGTFWEPILTSTNNNDLIAEEYEIKSYNINDYSIYNNNLYRCKTIIPTGESWDSNKWEQVTITDELENILSNKADITGDYHTLRAGEAEQLISSTTIIEKTPYNIRTTGGSINTTGRKNEKIVGGTICWNQKFSNPQLSTKTIWASKHGSLSVSNGIMDFTMAQTANKKYFSTEIDKVETNHVVLITFNWKETYTETKIRFRVGIDSPEIYSGDNSILFPNVTDFNGDQWYEEAIIMTTVANSNYLVFGTLSTTANSVNHFYLQAPQVYDLTQMFGKTIANYILELETNTVGEGVKWFRKLFPKSLYNYNSGQFLSVNTSSSNTIGFNAYNPNTHLAKVLGNQKYQITGNYTTISYININNETSTITPDENGYFTPLKDGVLTITGGDKLTTCVHLVKNGHKDNQWEPFEQYEYSLDSSLTLRGIPVLDENNNLYYDGDIYYPDGTVVQKYAYGCINSEGKILRPSDGEAIEWHGVVSSNYVYCVLNSSNNYFIQDKGFCTDYPIREQQGDDKWIRFYHSGNDRLLLRDTTIPGWTDATTSEELASAVTQYFANQYAQGNIFEIIFALQEPIVSDAQPYTRSQLIDNYGIEEFVDSNYSETLPIPSGKRDVKIPVGHETEYFFGLREKLENLPNPVNNDGIYTITQTNNNLSLVPYYIGIPLDASTISEMTNTSSIYLYNGSETGYTAGDWYYWNGENWVSGGVYNAQNFETDKTLSIENMAADAAIVGNFVDAIKIETTENPELQSGTITTNNGYEDDRSTRCRTGYIKVSPFGIKIKSISGNFQFHAFHYTEPNVAHYVGRVTTKWNNPLVPNIPAGDYVRFIIAKLDYNEDITKEECQDDIVITQGGYTDETLEQEFKAADAKATGDAITNISTQVEQLKNNTYSLYKNFENGNINSHGKSSDGSMNPLRSPFIPIDEFVSIQLSLNDIYKYQLFAYDALYTYLGYGNTSRKAISTREDVLLAYPNTKYVRIKLTAGEAEVLDVNNLDDYGYVGLTRISPESLQRIQISSEIDVQSIIEQFKNNNGTYTDSFAFTVPLENSPTILAITAQYTGEMPMIRMKDVNSSGSSTWSSASYELGGTREPTRHSWRLPPKSATYTIGQIIVTIPYGTEVFIRSAELKKDQKNKSYGGIIIHGHTGAIAPANTIEAFQIGAELGYTTMITIPKFTTESSEELPYGIGICYHDDGNVDQLRMIDGSTIPDAATTPISSKSYDYITQNWRINSTAWGILHVPTLDEYFRVCSLTGMTPILSIHSSPSGMFTGTTGTVHFQMIKALAKKWNVLKGIGIKSGSNAIQGCARNIFGTDARYIWLHGQSHDPYDAFQQFKNYGFIDSDATDLSNCPYDLTSEYFYTQVTEAGAHYENTMIQLSDYLEKGFKISIAETDSISGPEMKRLIGLGVTEFTVDSHISMGLDW